MSRSIRRFLTITLAAGSLSMASGQDLDERLSDILAAQPGPERMHDLLRLAVDEREAGRLPQAIVLSQQSVVEAERLDDRGNVASALVELSKAQLARGDQEAALRASLRAAHLLEDSTAEARSAALLSSARIFLLEGHPQKTLEYLAEAAPADRLPADLRAERLWLEARATAATLPPREALQRVEAAIGGCDPVAQAPTIAALRPIAATLAARAPDLPKALALEEAVLQTALAQGDGVQAGISANNRGELLMRSGRIEEAIRSLQGSSTLLDGHPSLLMDNLINLSHALARHGEHDKALRVVEQAERTAAAGHIDDQRSRLLRTRASILLNKGDLPGAQAKGLDALELADAENDVYGTVAACELLSTILQRMGSPGEARLYLKRARDHAQQATEQEQQQRTAHENDLLHWQRIERQVAEEVVHEQRQEAELRQLALDADNKKNELTLLTYQVRLQEAMHREESLAREQAQQHLQLAEAALETEHQQRLIKELDHERVMQRLEMGRMELEQKEHQHSIDLLEQRNQLNEARGRTLEANRKRQRLAQRGAIGISLAAALFALWMFRALRIARRKRRIISKQNERIAAINQELQGRNADMASSLSYARTIQSTIITSEAALRDTLPESFLFYRPLHQVSGDLPFLRREGDRVYVAAIDCTGHGVPAAMMTFIAHFGLNDLITRMPDAPAAVLLDHLHEHVRHTMKARNGNGLYNDGMDVALCAIDRRTGRGTFAGAQLPLLIERAGEVLALKGDLLPLGDDQMERPRGYTDHSIQLQRNDSIYLFTDGLTHQFGGPDGARKFSQGRLKRLLTSVAGQDIGRVKDQAVAAFEQWQGPAAQTDDVLMIGLRYAA